MPTALSLTAFIAKWQSYGGTERSGSQSHFIDLCHLLGQDTPSTDPTDLNYAFEKVVTKSTGATGFADVWMKGHFAWEYKSPGGDLRAAYDQLLRYKDGLDNPRLLVVCDFRRFEIHTNFNDTPARVYTFSLVDLADTAPIPGTPVSPLEVLRALFTDPDRLRPEYTTSQVTEQAAAQFAKLAEGLRRYGADPEHAARFLVRLLFCLFAQDVDLLPNRLFTRLVEATRTRSIEFTHRIRELFRVMATGGSFGADDVRYFDGGLFSDDTALQLDSDDMELLARACKMDWASIEPAILGTLFERSLDPDKRSQLGAHYTSRTDIMEIVEPVLMTPLRREWEEVRVRAEELVVKRNAARGAAHQRHQDELQRLLFGFAARLSGVRVLDPACGSGNFLYVALKQLLGLEKEAIAFAAANQVTTWFPQVGPEQLHGIEINPYAHELAQASIWIGYLQWLRDNGFQVEPNPVLKPLDSVMQMDAILTYDERGRPAEPEWPDADVIIGNPPFLGGKRLRSYLGDRCVDDLFDLYEGRVPREADLVCYWFERARALIEAGRVKRSGLLATQGIRGGPNRRVLERILATGKIFMAWSDRPWVLDGAAVRVSIVGFDAGVEPDHTLDGRSVPAINANLTGALDLTKARRLVENFGLSFMGITKVGGFDIPGNVARQMLSAPDPNGRSNREVIRPWVHGRDLNQRSRDWWIIDFSPGMSMETVALYEAPFEYIARNVKPKRLTNARATYAERWWIHGEARPAMRRALAKLRRYIATCMVAKHRIFVWLPPEALAENVVIVIARDDDYFFGVLHSKPHELWARGTGTQLREAESGFRYTPTTTFETFPFPWPPGKEPCGDPRVEAIAVAARELVELRDRWLNPEGATEAQLRERTLTNLYNQRPEWLVIAHRRLDYAVLDAYGWPHSLDDEEILSRLLALNLERVATEGA